MMYDLTKFSLGDMVTLTDALTLSTSSALSMEEAAQIIVRFLYENMLDPQTGTKSCALVRFYKTHAYKDLDAPLRKFAEQTMKDTPIAPDMKSLVLLATAGDKPAWNSRAASVGHKVIPLPSEAIINQSPMIAQLIRQLGLNIGSFLSPGSNLITNLMDRKYNVFHVAQALNSPFIPAQKEFVIPSGIESVLGFGGILASGDLFAVILFAKVSIPADVANLFKTIAVDTKMMIMPFNAAQTFNPA